MRKVARVPGATGGSAGCAPAGLLKAGQTPERDPAAADALGLLELAAGQDMEPAEGSDGTDGQWRIARKVPPERVIYTVDTQARHARTSKSRRCDGYRGM